MTRSSDLLRGTYRRSDVAWFGDHAYFDAKGVPRCIKTHEHIRSLIVHLARIPDTLGTPFILIENTATGFGTMVSFNVPWCPSCQSRQPNVTSVLDEDLVCIPVNP